MRGGSRTEGHAHAIGNLPVAAPTGSGAGFVVWYRLDDGSYVLITTASISHYRSIAETELSLGPINIFVGPNGSGKSNILDAIYFLHDCAAEGIDTAINKRHGIDSLRQWSRTRPYNIIINLKFQFFQESGSYKVILASTKGQYKILEESGTWHGQNPVIRANSEPVVATSSFQRYEDGSLKVHNPFERANTTASYVVEPEELFLTTLGTRVPFPHIMVFRSIARELMSFSKYNIYPNTLRVPQSVSREISLGEDGSNLASVLKAVNSGKRGNAAKDDIISALQMIMPSLVDFQVRSTGGYYVPMLRVREDNGDVHDFNLAQISDGTLRTLGLLCAFYQPSAPDKIGVEEPEQMIHPGALPVIHEAIKSFASSEERRGRQVFVTTHSPTLLDFFEPEQIIWTRLRNGSTECGPVKPRQMKIIKQQLFTAGELLLAEGIF